MSGTRTETDSLGEIEVPADAYWGAQTQRSIENFPFPRQERMPIRLIHALAAVKQASAAELAALRAELAEVKNGKEEDTEPAFREFVSRSKKNPFGGPGAPREDAAARRSLGSGW